MIVNNLFSVPVVFFDISEEILKSTLASVNRYIDESTTWKSQTAYGETFTTYHEGKNFLGNEEYADLTREINKNVRSFAEMLGKDPLSGLRLESWLNFNPPGTGHQRHEHYNSLASGVIYLDADSDTGEIVFYDPVETRTQANSFMHKSICKQNEFNVMNYRLKPQTGRMIMFEGWLHHSVDYNKTNKIIE